MIDEARKYLDNNGVITAVRDHDDETLFNWLMTTLSYQGVSDSVAFGYMEKHGRADMKSIATALGNKPGCAKLQSYWHYQNCRYRKTDRTCAEPSKLRRCPVPRLPLRNGRLNQTACSLFLFFRDVAGGDFVSWIDDRLAEADIGLSSKRGALMAAAVIEPLRNVYGIADKVISLGLAMLFLAGDPGRERWRATGAAMIAIDTLVHNWLHRTGILNRFDANHSYGVQCYAENGCAAIIDATARRIDTSALNADFPKVFPRLVQFAIWQFCSEAGLAQCNGNRIDDSRRCRLSYCMLFDRCDRHALMPRKPAA